MALSRLILMLWCAICASSAIAHEFWIEPQAYQVPRDAKIIAELKNGEEFVGISLPYSDRNFTRFDLVMGEALRPVAARLGDNPAINVAARVEGLAVVVHESTPSFVTYRDWAKFQKFADHKDFANIAARHTEHGFPEPPFKERYTRHAKALVAVGNGQGSDRPLGLKTEIVALTNPYEAAFDGTMQVQVLYLDAPRGDAQVEVFDRSANGDVAITLHRTDAKGIAEIPVSPGHSYLFDAVVIQPIKDHDKAVWDTFWAALTFAVPPTP